MVRVLEDTVEHVGDVDENVGTEHALPEVPRVAHLGHDVEENHGSTVRVDDVVDTLVSTEESFTTRGKSSSGAASELFDGLGACSISAREVLESKGSTASTITAKHSCIVGLSDSAYANGNE